jgi:LPS-assembly protein
VNPLGLGQNPSIDQIKKIHTTRFGLENTVQTRSQEYGSRTLLRLNLYQDLLFAKGIEENTFDSFYSDLELTPADWLQLDFLSRLKTEDLTLKNYSSALTLKDGDVRSIQFGTEILQNEIEEYFVRANVRINQNFGISTKITFDAEDEEWSELIGGLDTMLGRYWKIASSFGYQQNSERRGNWRLDMNLRLLSF